MNANELRKQTVAQLNDELVELRKEQFNLRMQAGIGQSPRQDRFGRVRRDIARVKTVINQKVAAGETA